MIRAIRGSINWFGFNVAYSLISIYTWAPCSNWELHWYCKLLNMQTTVRGRGNKVCMHGNEASCSSPIMSWLLGGSISWYPHQAAAGSSYSRWVSAVVLHWSKRWFRQYMEPLISRTTPLALGKETLSRATCIRREYTSMVIGTN